MIKLKGHASSFSGVSQSHFSPSEITQSVIESTYFSGYDNLGKDYTNKDSVNKYFYESSNGHVAFKGTVIDWIEFDQDL